MKLIFGCRVIIVCVVLSSIVALMSGCSSKPTKFYVLTPLAPSAIMENALSDESLSVGLGPISLPDYANRPQIVTTNGSHELAIDEYHRWAESLLKNVSRVLSENFATILNTENINTYPWNRFLPIDYQVAIDITKFDSVIDKEATLEARWVISTDRGRQEVVRRKTYIAMPTEGGSYDDIVAAQSEALATLSDQIAQELNTHPIAKVEQKQ